MNTAQYNIQHHFLLHETAMECLRLISRFKETGNKWGVEHFSAVYAGVLQEITGAEIEKAVEHIYANLQVDSNGILISTPENE
jgi:hypothetical protein